jgi:NCS1 family nucleobase:cation symporter-1
MAAESMSVAAEGLRHPEADIPVREGEYGDRVMAVEPGGIEYIALAERHGSPRRLFWTWNSPNWEFATMFLGVIPITVFGGGFVPTVVAVILGSALGAAAVGLLSTWGPRFGVPQLVQSRSAFGYFGNFLPAGLNTLTAGVGWFAVNTISGTFALSTLTHLPFQVALIVIVLLQVFVAFIGHNFIHQFEKVAFPYLAIVFTIATLVILTQSNPGVGFNAKAPVAFGGPLGAFILAVFVAFSYSAGWAPYSMDFARYLPPNSESRRVFWSAMLGVFVPCAILEIGGAALATVAGTAWGPTDSPTDQLVKPLPGILAGLTLFGIALGAISANVLNIYSGSMSFLALGVRFGSLHLQRAIVAVLFGVIGYLVARAGEVDAGHAYENFLLLIGYWITPFLGVVLTDFWLRRGRYDEREFFDRRHNTFAGVAAMAAGILVSVPFWNQALWHGPVVDALPQLGDLSFIVGFVVATVVYYALSRSARSADPKRAAAAG